MLTVSRLGPLALLSCLAVGCASGPEGFTTLLGEPLPAPTMSAEARAEQEARLADAEARFASDPGSEDALVWVGRRLAYLGRYREAIETYSRGLEVHPESVRLLRHRGHRWITVRELRLAVTDLQRATALLGVEGALAAPGLHVEQDGLPNQAGIPLSTTEGNVHYHLGLAHYLRGDFDAALAAYDRRREQTDRNDDNRCATAYWRYLCLARTGRADEARAALEGIDVDTEVIENGAYRDLVLLFRGDLTEDEVLERNGVSSAAAGVPGATLAYGLAMAAALREGDREVLESRCRAIVSGSDAASAFGFIAAEAELASERRLR